MPSRGASSRIRLHDRVRATESAPEASPREPTFETQPLLPFSNHRLVPSGQRNQANFDEVQALCAGRLSYGVTPAEKFAQLEAMSTRLAFAAQPEVFPEAVFTGDRRQVTTTKQYPFSSICHLRSLFLSPDGGYIPAVGTGWVIGPRTVITAGHCLYIFHNSQYGLEQVWATHVEVIPGRNGENWPFRSFAVGREGLHSTSGWVHAGRDTADYGAIVLQDNLPEVIGTFGFAVLRDDELEGLSANVVGYPGEYKRPPLVGTMWGDASPPLDRPSSHQLRYTIDTTPGQSGSPVFYVRPEIRDAIAVGIHNYGQTDVVNFATRITKQVQDNLLAWRAEGGA